MENELSKLKYELSEFESKSYYKSRKTHQIHSNWIVDNENEEYINASKLFEIKENILDLSNEHYKVIWIDNERCFYAKEIPSQKIYKLDESDIKLIHANVYGKSTIVRELKSITILSNSKCQYNYKPELIFSGKPLCLDLIICFIANSFDITNTIYELSNKKKNKI